MSGNYSDSYGGGSGTENDPYLISTPEQLARISAISGDLSKYFLQTADLDMSAHYWGGIAGGSNSNFKGRYDGGGYTISNINMTSDYGYYFGLFGYVTGTIINVNLDNSVFDCDFDLGGIASRLDGGSITYCNVSNTTLKLINYNYVGGIVGYAFNSAKINNCSFSGEVSAEENTNSISAGGIIGYAYNTSSIFNCKNSGNISSTSCVGGIVADIFTPNVAIDIHNCVNIGLCKGGSSEGGVVGGIIGQVNNNVDIYECYNAGEIKWGKYSGGIVGQRYAYGNSRIYNCYNTGNITGANYSGGIVGDADVYSGNYCYIYNCYNTGKISSENNGGIGGSTSDVDYYSNVSIGTIIKANKWRICGVLCASNSSFYSSFSYYTESATQGSSDIAINACELCTDGNVRDINWYTTTSNWYSNYQWDFENTWAITSGVNDGLPYLRDMTWSMSFTITYHPNGASGDEVVESKVGSEVYTIRSNMFTRSGYNFTGWNTEANGSGESYSVGSSYSELANLDLYAQWSRITYTIIYNKNASDATGTMASTTKYYGTNVTLRSNAFKRTGYSFAGWATEKGGNVVYSNGATYSANANVTLYAKWTAHKYTVKFNGNGSTSGSMKEQTFEYGTAQKLTSNAFKKTGFTFSKWTRNADGTGTSYTNGQSVSNLTSSNGATINLYAQWTARNEAKYDSAGKYWYVENGKIPQTKVTNSTLISNLNKATTNGSNYYIAGQTLTAKVYNGTEYCKWNNNWYEVEPIKWRLDASSSQKDGYGTTTDTNAVLAEIVYVDQYSSTSIDANEGYSSQSVTDFMRNGISTTYLVNYATSTQTFGTGTSLYGTNASTTARMFVSSQSEINAVNGTMNITFSDLVEDMIKYYGGTNVYFTRDLGSNYNNIVCFNEVGREVQRFATDYRGVQFTVRFTEYGCVN